MWFLEVLRHLSYADAIHLVQVSRLFYRTISDAMDNIEYWKLLPRPVEITTPLVTLADYESVHIAIVPNNRNTWCPVGRLHSLLESNPALIKELIAIYRVGDLIEQSFLYAVHSGVAIPFLLQRYGEIGIKPSHRFTDALVEKDNLQDLAVYNRIYSNELIYTTSVTPDKLSKYIQDFYQESLDVYDVWSLLGHSSRIEDFSPEIIEALKESDYPLEEVAYLVRNAIHKSGVAQIDSVIKALGITEDSTALSVVIEYLVIRLDVPYRSLRKGAHRNLLKKGVTRELPTLELLNLILEYLTILVSRKKSHPINKPRYLINRDRIDEYTKTLRDIIQDVQKLPLSNETHAQLREINKLLSKRYI